MGSEQKTADKRPSWAELAEQAREAQITERLNVVSGLSVMERRFTIRYLVHGNRTQAADEAGYAYPDKQGSRLAKRPKIKAAIEEYFYQEEMSSKEVIARLSEQAKGEYAAFIRTAQGNAYVDVEAMLAAGKGHLIKEIKTTQYGQTVVFHDAQSALVHVGRYHGLFKDRMEHEGKVDVPFTAVIAALQKAKSSPEADEAEESGGED